MDDAATNSENGGLLERRQRVLGSAYRLFYDEPLHLIRGEGARLYDSRGRAYLDAYNNVAVVGHSHPHVVETLARQAGLLNTHTRYLHEATLDYAERLTATFPAPLAQVIFTCTGSEANDLAYRMARSITGRDGVIVTENAYHGVTAAVAAFSPSLGRDVAPAAHVRTVAAPDTYRGGTVNLARRFAEQIREAAADLLRAGVRPAALFCDTVFASDGIFPESTDVLMAGAQAIREVGGLFVADEVQGGFGRSGDGLWSFLREACVPDIVTLGKPMGNGHPIAAVVAGPCVMEPFGKRGRYFNTFGGNPVSSAVGLAVLNIIEGENLVANAAEVGGELKRRLSALAADHEVIGDIRGRGLYIGVELVRDRTTMAPAADYAARLINLLRDRGVLVGVSGASGNVIKVRPPLIFSRADSDEFLLQFDCALRAIRILN